MKKLLLLLASLTLFAPAANAETVYLIIKSGRFGGGLALHSIPMDSIDQCEEAGGLLFASKRFDTKEGYADAYECITGK